MIRFETVPGGEEIPVEEVLDAALLLQQVTYGVAFLAQGAVLVKINPCPREGSQMGCAFRGFLGPPLTVAIEGTPVQHAEQFLV